MTTTVGEAASIEIKNISFNDESAIAPLEKFNEVYTSAEIYLTGELTIDFPEDVKIPVEPNQMVTAVLSGNRIKCALLWGGESDRTFEWAVCSGNIGD